MIEGKENRSPVPARVLKQGLGTPPKPFFLSLLFNFNLVSSISEETTKPCGIYVFSFTGYWITENPKLNL